MIAAPSASSTFSSAIADASRYTAWIVAQFAPYLGNSTLEIGVGHGSYIEHLARGRRYAGLDIDPEAAADAQKRHPQHRFFCADLGDPAFPAQVEQRFDSVVCCNVLEHIADDRLAIANMASVLNPQGRLLLFVPALPALYTALDKFAGHHRRYTRQVMGRLLRAADLDVLEMRYFNALGGLGWWLNRAASHQSLNDPAVNAQIRAFDKWGVPVSKAIDPLFRHVFGQSLISVARRT